MGNANLKLPPTEAQAVALQYARMIAAILSFVGAVIIVGGRIENTETEEEGEGLEDRKDNDIAEIGGRIEDEETEEAAERPP
jgi:hypothetical protein